MLSENIVSRRSNKGFCNGDHEWGDFMPYGNYELFKKCRNCPGKLSRGEYLANKGPELIKTATLGLEVKEYISLFY